MENKRKDEIWNECYLQNSTLRETWRMAMEKYAIEYHEQQLNKPAVSNQRELLVAFLREYHTSMLVFAEMPDIEKIVDDYLKRN